MKSLVLILTLLMSACATTQIVPVMVMPTAPANLLVPTTDLTTIPVPPKPQGTEAKHASG